MAENARELQQILSNQQWIKAALGELLENSVTSQATSTSQLATLDALLVVLKDIRDSRTTDEEALLMLKSIQAHIEILIQQF